MLSHGEEGEEEGEEGAEHEAMESPEEEKAEHESGDEVQYHMDAYKADPSPENLEKLLSCLEAKKAEQQA